MLDGSWKIPQGFHFFLHRGDSLPTDLVSEELKSLLTEDTLVQREGQASLVQPLEEQLQSLHVLLVCPAEDQNIVEIAKYSRDASQDIVKETLERLSTVLETHCKSPEIEQTPWSGDTCFPPISLVYDDLVERLGHVNLAEDPGASYVLVEGAKIRKRVEIKQSLLVE